jgi:hypothetical protein
MYDFVSFNIVAHNNYKKFTTRGSTITFQAYMVIAKYEKKYKSQISGPQT